MTLSPTQSRKPRKRIKSSKKTLANNRMIKALDDAAREAVFLRDQFSCIRCGKKENLQWCHVLSRRNRSLRWEVDNAMCLDAGCHLFWHHEPALAVDWFKTNFREQWDRLMALRIVDPRMSVKERYEQLKAV